MTDSKAAAAPAPEATSVAAPSPPQTAAPVDPPASPLQAEPQADVTALAKEAADTKDRLLRTLAEMENLRRRTEREVADARTYGISGFGRDMLGVADNLRRALAAIATESRDGLPAPIVAFIEGVELTERELLKAFERNGVKKFDPVGEKFDPNVHQAMFEIPDPTAPNGTVVQVVQSGYMIGERVLRPAMVGVSKGGPKTAPAPTAAPAASGPDAGAGDKPGAA